MFLGDCRVTIPAPLFVALPELLVRSLDVWECRDLAVLCFFLSGRNIVFCFYHNLSWIIHLSRIILRLRLEFFTHVLVFEQLLGCQSNQASTKCIILCRDSRIISPTLCLKNLFPLCFRIAVLPEPPIFDILGSGPRPGQIAKFRLLLLLLKMTMPKYYTDNDVDRDPH